MVPVHIPQYGGLVKLTARIVNGGTVSVTGPSTFDTHTPPVRATILAYTPAHSPVIVTMLSAPMVIGIGA